MNMHRPEFTDEYLSAMNVIHRWMCSVSEMHWVNKFHYALIFWRWQTRRKLSKNLHSLHNTACINCIQWWFHWIDSINMLFINIYKTDAIELLATNNIYLIGNCAFCVCVCAIHYYWLFEFTLWSGSEILLAYLLAHSARYLVGMKESLLHDWK